MSAFTRAPFDSEPRSSLTIPVESTVGTLIEIRFIGSPSMDEVVAFEAKLQTLVRRIVKHGKRRAIICTDLRACLILRPEVSQRLISLMQSDNPHIERNAFLEQASAVFGLQVQRLISESGARDRRRIFKDASQLMTWLTEVTNAAEQARLRTFLASGSPATDANKKR